MAIAPKHVGAVLTPILMWILKLFLRQFTCASVGELNNFDNIKIHGMYVKKKTLLVSSQITFWYVSVTPNTKHMLYFKEFINYLCGAILTSTEAIRHKQVFSSYFQIFLFAID
jgi:hypothetical protein